MNDSGGVLATVPGAKRQDAVLDAIEERGRFSLSLSKPDYQPKQVDLALISIGGETLDYAALARRGPESATAAYTVSFNNLVDLKSISVATLGQHLESRTRTILEELVGIGGGRVPPKTWLRTWTAIRELRPKLRKQLDKLALLRDLRPEDYNKRGFSVVAQEKDAVTIALDIFDYPRKQFFSQWTPPDPSKPAPFLQGLGTGQVMEDMMVSHDARAVPGWFPEPENLMGVVTLSRPGGSEQLTIVNANRTSIEKTLGVDLVYYLHAYRSFVMVQYKRMEREAKAPLGYRPIDKPYLAEVKRMAAFLRKQPPHEPKASDDFRLCHNPFFFKLCPKELLDPFKTGPMPGMYLPYDYWKLLLESKLVKGVKGGVRVTYDSAKRWISNDLFVSLVQHGWVGTPIDAEKELSDIIQRSLEANKSVVYASSSQGTVPGSTIGEDEVEAEWESIFGDES